MTYTFTCHQDTVKSTKGIIVRFDNATLLLDPSWTGESSYEDCTQFWRDLIPQIDIILLSQPTREYLGAYTLLYREFLSHFKTRILVYATLPVVNLGRITTIEQYVSKGIVGPFDSAKMDIEDIEMSFDHIMSLKYFQTVDLKSKYDGLSLIAYNSGYAPGGAIWCITTYSEKILYLPRWNHTRDTILNSASILDKNGKPMSVLMRPSAIITSNNKLGSPIPHRKRATKFKDIIKKAINSNTSVVIPTSLGGKFMELLALMHNFFYDYSKSNLLSDLSILLVSYSKGRVLTYAKSMLEWLSSEVVKTYEARDNRSPFDLGKGLKIVSPEGISKYPGIKICFVSDVESLVNDVISRMCTREKATVILTEKFLSYEDHILSRMYFKWQKSISATDPNSINSNPILFLESVTINQIKLQPLTNDEVNIHREVVEQRWKERSELLEKLTSCGTNEDELAGSTSFDEEDEEEDILGTTNHQNSLRPKIEMPVDTIILQNFLPKHKMFGFQPGKVKHDEYGDFVDFSQFIQITGLNKRGFPDEIGEDEEDYDPYELEDSRRSQGNGNNYNIKRQQEQDNSIKNDNYDDITYLDVLNRPQHRIKLQTQIDLRCSVVFIDMESVVDTRSASIILPALKPKKILFLPPFDISNHCLIDQFEKRSLEVVKPEFNINVEMHTTTKSLDISIDLELDQSLKWQKISDGYSIAHVVGRLVNENDPKLSHRDKLFLKPLFNASKINTKGFLHIGDVRLAELKRKLNAQNHVAEFKGEGILVVDGKVAVHKISDGETIVDGQPSELFYKVKSAVKDMLAQV